MKTNIKMRVTPEQSKKVQEICFDNNIFWKSSRNSFCDYPLIFIKQNVLVADTDCESDFEEIDADLFIRTNGTCEESFKDKEVSYFKQAHDYYKKVEDSITNLIIVELQNKLKKKNEILKKARIKRKNQREELNKLNIKLQKCISLEEHNKIIEKINKGNVNYLSNNIISRDKEIEKLKVIIEYLESKVK